MKNTLLWILILCVIIFGSWFLWGKYYEDMIPSTPQNNEQTSEDQDLRDRIQVDTIINPITSPLTITWQARWTWYFEASFPIELRDGMGALITNGIAQAQADWMTEDWVPFTATLTFPAQLSGSVGQLILRRDNPSGESQYDASIVVPVQF